MMSASTIVFRVSAHGHLNTSCDFGPHDCLPRIYIAYVEANCYIDPLTWALIWVLAQNTTVRVHNELQYYT